MPSYEGCRVEIVCAREGRLLEVDDAELRIDEQGLELSFWDDEGAYVFVAAPSASGHYELTCRSRPRVATLHRPERAAWLVGSWSERDERGYWRVELPVAPEGSGGDPSAG